jgi:hypothetical protein
MSKKIDEARKNLTRALKKHAEVVGARAVSLKKAQRAAAKVQAAAVAYADAVQSKSGLGNPFTDVAGHGLETSTIASLSAERDAIARGLTGPIPVHEGAVASAESAKTASL